MPFFLDDQVSRSSGILSAGKAQKVSRVKNMGTVLVVEALNHTSQSRPTTSAFEQSVRSSNLGLANSEFAPKCTTSGNAPSNKRPQITCTKGAQRWLGKIARRVPLVASNAKSSPHAPTLHSVVGKKCLQSEKQYLGVHFYAMYIKNYSMLRINNVFGIFNRGQRQSPESPSFQQLAPGRWLVNWALLELCLSASPRSLPRWCVHQLHDRWHRTALSVIDISHLAEQQGTPKCLTIFVYIYIYQYVQTSKGSIPQSPGLHYLGNSWFISQSFLNESQLSYLPKWHHETNK